LQLAYWADSKTGYVTRSHQQLAEETGYSVRTVQDALKELTQPGCVFIERKRRTSRRGRLADSYKILAVLPAKTAEPILGKNLIITTQLHRTVLLRLMRHHAHRQAAATAAGRQMMIAGRTIELSSHYGSPASQAHPL